MVIKTENLRRWIMLKLRGLYYITHINNLPSILERGILCHRKIEEEKIAFTPIYDAEIVASRKEKNYQMDAIYGILQICIFNHEMRRFIV